MQKQVRFLDETYQNTILFSVVFVADSNSSVTQASWFWPVLVVSFGIALSVPIIIITVVLFCMSSDDLNDSEESAINANSSSTSSEQHLSGSEVVYYVEGFPSPPPPYQLDGRPLCIAFPPPPYESASESGHSRTLSTIINMESSQPIANQSTETNVSQPSPCLSFEITSL